MTHSVLWMDVPRIVSIYLSVSSVGRILYRRKQALLEHLWWVSFSTLPSSGGNRLLLQAPLVNLAQQTVVVLQQSSFDPIHALKSVGSFFADKKMQEWPLVLFWLLSLKNSEDFHRNTICTQLVANIACKIQNESLEPEEHRSAAEASLLHQSPGQCCNCKNLCLLPSYLILYKVHQKKQTKLWISHLYMNADSNATAPFQ